MIPTYCTIQEAIQQHDNSEEVTVQGWLRNRRFSKHIFFLMLHDGSTFHPLQVVGEVKHFPEELCKQFTVGTSLSVTGRLIPSVGQQAYELQAKEIKVTGSADTTYPLQPKAHSLAFLRTLQHFRPRTNTFQAVFRIRHALSMAIHNFFHECGFYWFHTPIITSLDAEGTGKMFSVATSEEKGLVNNVFFKKKVALTVSGQLAGEAGALGLGKVYAFGPTFRAENSNTTRHFWLYHPEFR